MKENSKSIGLIMLEIIPDSGGFKPTVKDVPSPEPITTDPVVIPTSDPVVEEPKPVIEEPTIQTPDLSNKIDIDGVIYTLDDKGNAIDSNNAVKYTSEQIAAFEGAADTSVNIDNIIETVNIKPVNEKGEPIDYENTPEGISQYVADVYEVSRQQAVVDYEKELLSKYPILPDVLRHIELNGSLEGFNKKVDYSTIDLKDDNITQHKQIIIEARIKRGDTPEKAERYVKMLEDANATYDEAKEELAFLGEISAREVAIEEAKLNELRVKAEDDAMDYWGIKIENGQLVDLNKQGSVYNMIKNGKITIDNDNYTIPERIRINEGGKVSYATRQDFFNYLYNPVDVVIDGNKVKMTRHDLDIHNESLKRNTNHDLFDAFKRFVKYDVDQFIKTNMQQQTVKKLSTNIRKTNTNPALPPVVTGDRIVIKRD